MSEQHKILSQEGMGALAQGAALALRCLALVLLRDGRCAELTGGQYFMLIFFSFLSSGVFVKLRNVIKHLVSNLRFDWQKHECPAKKSGNKNVVGRERSTV